MNRINTIQKQTKIPTLQKVVPKTHETIRQQKIESILPNELHNLENPSVYLENRRNSATCKT